MISILPSLYLAKSSFIDAYPLIEKIISSKTESLAETKLVEFNLYSVRILYYLTEVVTAYSIERICKIIYRSTLVSSFEKFSSY